MMHKMKLFEEPFYKIKSGQKVIEVRLHDKKREKINIDDEIEFALIENPVKRIRVKVLGLSKFKQFKDLYSSIHHEKLGHPKGLKLVEKVRTIRNIYPVEKEREFGVLGIHIRVIS